MWIWVVCVGVFVVGCECFFVIGLFGVGCDVVVYECLVGVDCVGFEVILVG